MNIDTLAIARDLRATELPVAQAEAIAAAIGRSVSENVSTKGDVERVLQKIDALGVRMDARIDTLSSRVDTVERTLGARIDAVDAQLTSKIDNARSAILTWLMGAILATTGIVITVVRYL